MDEMTVLMFIIAVVAIIGGLIGLFIMYACFVVLDVLFNNPLLDWWTKLVITFLFLIVLTSITGTGVTLNKE